MSDIRDIAALMPCDHRKVQDHLLRGDIKILKNEIKKQEKFLQKPQFDDSFKGIFGVHIYKKEDLEKTKELAKVLLKN